MKEESRERAERMASAHYFANLFFPSERHPGNPHDGLQELSEVLKEFAYKYLLHPPRNSKKWHDYSVMNLKKILRDMPSTIADLDKALDALNAEEVKANACGGEVNIQDAPEPAPAAASGNDMTPTAPAAHQDGEKETKKVGMT